MDGMKKALVLGASGGMGYSIVKELSNRGVEVIAFSRTKSKLEKLFSLDQNVHIFAGDIFNKEDLIEASKGVDVIFQSANIPYIEWEEKLISFMKNIVEVVQQQSIKLAVVDNIYSYGRSNGEKVSEVSQKNPHTKKGRIRLHIEKMIKDSGIQALIAHFPDFYGPNAENTILHYTLDSVVKNKKAVFVGDKRIPREYIFTPDGAKALVNLALNESSYGQTWNIPGYDVITGEELISIVRDRTNFQKSVTTISKNMIRFMGLFNANMREVIEMFYLNEEPVVLSGEKYEREIGPIPRTSYQEGLRQTLEFMSQAY
jgi:nucleoside-diphosphate-sugar epimerase